jgi:hypothetical protein
MPTGGGTLCLVIRSIDEGARLTLKAAGHGPPIFTVEERATASPIARLARSDPDSPNVPANEGAGEGALVPESALPRQSRPGCTRSRITEHKP